MGYILEFTGFIVMSCALLTLGKSRACRSSHVNRALAGYHCPGENNLIKNVSNVDQPQCFYLCMQHNSCILIAYDADERQCKLSSEVCQEAAEHGHFALTALGPPRSSCMEWQKTGASWPPSVVVVNEVGEVGNNFAVGRFEDGGLLLPAWCDGGGDCKSTHETVYYTSTSGEYLLVTPGCPILWVPWSGTPGEDLPTGALVGGHLSDGTKLYVAKAWVGNTVFRLGYYNPVTALGHFWYTYDRPTSHVSLLILIWMSFLWLKWNHGVARRVLGYHHLRYA